MAKPIVVFEYDYIPISLKYINRFKKINKAYSKTSNEEDAVFKIYGNQVKVKQFVGVIKVGNQTIQILPKLLSEKNHTVDQNNSEIIKNLLFMLKYTSKLDLKETDLVNLKKCEDIFEVIIYLFAKNLLELLKFDLVKNYELKKENLSCIKGKIQFTKHIKSNLLNKSKFYCEFDEFTSDNLLNQLFKSTICKLIKITKSNENYKLLVNCNIILSDISLKHLKEKDLKKIKFTRFNQCYKPSYNLAKLLLFGNSVELSSADINTTSLLFDMNKLFEEFITKFITKEFQEYEIKAQSQLHLFENPRSFLLKPDILLINKNNSKIIIDTKYKLLQKEENNNHNNVYSGDIYQMIAYSTRFFESEKSDFKKLILLYPENKEKIIGKRYIQNNLIIKIETVNLHQDLMKKANILKRELKEIIGSSINQDTFK